MLLVMFYIFKIKIFFRKNWNKRGKDLNNIFDNIGNVYEFAQKLKIAQ
jgi:hypothetical protein